ncbi:sulfatase AtsG, partial [gut metagenome]
LEAAIQSSHADIRFWGAVGYAQLAQQQKIKDCPQALQALLQDANPYIASEAAYAMAYLGKAKESIQRLIQPIQEKDRKIGYSSLECLSLDPAMSLHFELLVHLPSYRPMPA